MFSPIPPHPITLFYYKEDYRRAPKLSESKFIKQGGNTSADSCPRAEPQEQRGLSLYTN
jgi:hypothetical protein